MEAGGGGRRGKWKGGREEVRKGKEEEEGDCASTCSIVLLLYRRPHIWFDRGADEDHGHPHPLFYLIGWVNFSEIEITVCGQVW